MRICLINEFFYPDDTGGTGNVLSDLMRALRHAHDDAEIDVVTSRNTYRRSIQPVQRAGTPDKPWNGRMFRFAAPETDRRDRLSAHDAWAGVEIFRLGTPHPNNRPLPARLIVNLVFCFAALIFLLGRRRYDLVLVTTAPPMVAIAAFIYKALTGIPYVYVVYDLEPDLAVRLDVVSGSNPCAAAFRLLQASCLRSAAKVIALGRCMKNHLIASYGLEPGQVDVIPIGYDPSSLWPMSHRTLFRAAHGLEDKFVVLYSGNLGRHHNFDTVLDAAKTLQASRPDVRFVLVGGGFQEEHIRNRIAAEKIDNTALYPFVGKEDLPDLMATADLSIITHERRLEGLCVPSKFYSVMASGRPILAMVSPETEIGWVIEESGCGVRVDHDTSDQLADAVVRLADDPEALERMGVNARKELIERFSITRVAESYYAVFCAVVGTQRLRIERAKLTDAEAIETT